jgi:hypothetical protein
VIFFGKSFTLNDKLMDEAQIKELLEKILGSRRAANGIIFPGEDGDSFYAVNLLKKEEMDGLTEEETFFIGFCAKSEIIRLRSLKTAHDYLLRIRAHAIVDKMRAYRVMLARKQKYTSNGKPWSLSNYYHSKDYYHKSYIGRLFPRDSKRLKKLPAGLAFIQEANAICMRSLLGDVVIVSESLEYFYYFMTIAFYGANFSIPILDRSRALLIATRIMNDSEALDFEIDSRGSLPDEIEEHLQKLVSAQMEFTFGHEYSHYLLGHLDQPGTRLMAVHGSTDETTSEKMAVYAHDFEFQADLHTLKIIEHDKRALSFVAMGAFLVFLYLNFLEDAHQFLGVKKFSVSSTHPKPIDRLLRLHRSLGAKSPLSDASLNECLEVSQQLTELFVEDVKRGVSDILTFYGSIYLPSYTKRMRKDRIEF